MYKNDDRIILVAFYDDHIGQNHDQYVGRTRAKIPCNWRNALVTPIITEIDQSEPVPLGPPSSNAYG